MLDYLPNEIMIETFTYVLHSTSYRELANLRRTNKRWRDCINVVIRNEIVATYGLGKKWWCWVKVLYSGEGGLYTHNNPVTFDCIDNTFCFKVSEKLFYPKKVRKIAVEFCNNKVYFCSEIIIKVNNIKKKQVQKNDSGSVHFVNNNEIGEIKLDYVKVKDNIVFSRIMTQQTGSPSSNTPTPQFHYETLNKRIIRKLKEQPLISLGMFATVFALTGATIGFYRGDSKTMQRFLRFRVAAQGFTVVVLAGVPLYYQIDRYIKKNQN
ncbi:hypothetical protein RclHR1_00520027 [Rhizophagus clarus]|uniref:Mitochondrial hypoxia responsive domain-containing protein n=1 Tax=Rhizophagus clarus TaxID=94130 RepID=A0A2Z6RYS8_9GLOM|nr:hypothetical protein RclHR1_00520027 [Rhizophagus clarus]GES77831.1 mitochondrial hypoxia responsive domain-containing protein [Rhizophagus clarus]